MVRKMLQNSVRLLQADEDVRLVCALLESVGYTATAGTRLARARACMRTLLHRVGALWCIAEGGGRARACMCSLLRRASVVARSCMHERSGASPRARSFCVQGLWRRWKGPCRGGPPTGSCRCCLSCLCVRGAQM